MKFSRYFIFFFIFIFIYFCFFYNNVIIKNDDDTTIIAESIIITPTPTQTTLPIKEQVQKQQKDQKPMDKLEYVKEIINNNKLVLFSKTYCPYCKKVKKLFNDIGAKPFIIELDVIDDGVEIQSILLNSISKSRTVPQVFISNKFIGGCDDTHNLHNQGKLLPLLKEASTL